MSGPTDSIDPASIQRVLVVKLRHHGDVLLTSPVFSALKAHAPQAEIDALVYADTREMLTLHPAISSVHVIDRAWKKQGFASRLAAEAGLFGRLRARRYDLLIHLTEHPRGAWLARALGCARSVAPSYPGKPAFWNNSFTHRYSLPLNARRHMVEWNLDALRRIGMQPEPDMRRLVYVPGLQAEAEIDRLLAAHGLESKGYIHFHPASRWQFKCWSVENTAALIDRLSERGYRVVLTAAPTAEEKHLTQAILKACRASDAGHVRLTDLSGQLSLKALVALTARARLFIGVDSAPMHIAAAMQTPVVALFGPSGEQQWGPWSQAFRVVSSQTHACRPCGIDGCGGGKVSDCLVSLPVERVLAAVDELL